MDAETIARLKTYVEEFRKVCDQYPPEDKKEKAKRDAELTIISDIADILGM